MKIDLVVEDSARIGAADNFLNAPVETAAKKDRLYLHNPMTQKESAAFLAKSRYENREIQPKDICLFAEHVQTEFIAVKGKQLITNHDTGYKIADISV